MTHTDPKRERSGEREAQKRRLAVRRRLADCAEFVRRNGRISLCRKLELMADGTHLLPGWRP